MDPNEPSFSEDVNKMLKNYANYKNICVEFKRERQAEKEEFEGTLPSFTLARKKCSRKISKNADYTSKFLNISTSRSEESIEVETGRSLNSKEASFSSSEQSEYIDLVGTAVGKKYEEKFRTETAAMQKEIDKLKLGREQDIDESNIKIESLENMLKQERCNSKEKFYGLVSHYEKILQQTKNINNQMMSDYNHIQTKMDSLKEQVRSMHEELQSDLSNNFNKLLNGIYTFNETNSSLSLTKASLDKGKEKIKEATFYEEKIPNVKAKIEQIYKKQQKPLQLKTKKIYCSRKDKDKTSRNT